MELILYSNNYNANRIVIHSTCTVLFYILLREDWIFGIISVLILIFINAVLFWQISALDLESINVKFLFYK